MAGFRKKQRIQLIALGTVFLAAATALGIYAGRESFEFAWTPTQVFENDPAETRRFRLIGLVEDGSIIRGEGTEVRFRVTDTENSIEVRYNKILPALFRAGQGTIVTGTLAGDLFTATEVLAKHDEKYMPKEVADALKEQGVFKPEEPGS